MTADVTNLNPPNAEQISLVVGAALTLEHRFILTQVEQFTLVFPAPWVAEIIRIDRSQILDLPFYDSLLVGVANHNAQVTPLIAASALLEVAQLPLPERLMVVRLNEGAGRLENVGLIVDRAIGSSTRQELPPELFTAHQAGTMVMMQSHLVPTSLWQPQYWSVNN